MSRITKQWQFEKENQTPSLSLGILQKRNILLNKIMKKIHIDRWNQRGRFIVESYYAHSLKSFVKNEDIQKGRMHFELALEHSNVYAITPAYKSRHLARRGEYGAFFFSARNREIPRNIRAELASCAVILAGTSHPDYRAGVRDELIREAVGVLGEIYKSYGLDQEAEFAVECSHFAHGEPSRYPDYKDVLERHYELSGGRSIKNQAIPPRNLGKENENTHNLISAPRPSLAIVQGSGNDDSERQNPGNPSAFYYHRKISTYHGRVRRTFQDALPLIDEGWILEVGSCTGETTRELAETYTNSRILGLDISLEALGVAMKNKENKILLKNGRISFELADAYYLESKIDPSVKFSAVFYMNSLVFASEQMGVEAAAQVVARTSPYLLEGGYVLISADQDYSILQWENSKFKIVSLYEEWYFPLKSPTGKLASYIANSAQVETPQPD